MAVYNIGTISGGSGLANFAKGKMPRSIVYTVAPLPALEVKSVPGMAAGAYVNGAVQFERSAIPAGQVPTLTPSGGVALVPKIGNVKTWDDGSLMGCAFWFPLPAAIAAGAAVQFQWGKQAGTIDTTAGATVAACAAAADFKINLGLLASVTDTTGGVAYSVDFAAILNAGPAWSATTGYGTNPTQGYKIIRSTSDCLEVQVWGYFKATTGGAMHTLLKGGAYLRYWLGAAGAVLRCQARPYVRQSNSYGAHPSGTVGPTGAATNTAVNLIWHADFCNGATVLASLGGASDPRSVTLQATNFDTTNNVLTGTNWALSGETAPSYSYALQVYGWPLMFSGTGTPSGLTQGTIYHNSGNGGFTPLLSASQTNLQNSAFGTAGTGTSTLTVYVVTCPGTCQYFANPTTGNRLWVPLSDASIEPSYSIAHDVDYLGRHARIIPVYDNSLKYVPGNFATVQPEAVRTQIYCYPNGVADESDAVGANPDVERIGYLTTTSASLLLCPHDPWRETFVRNYALKWLDFNSCWDDERAGTPSIRSTTQYPGLAAPNANFCTGFGGTGGTTYGSPAWMGIGVMDSTGLQPMKYNSQGYNPLSDGSHIPAVGLIPWLQTGDFEYVEIHLYQTLCDLFSQSPTNPNTILWGEQQVRGNGWAMRLLLFAEAMLPDGHEHAQFIKDVADTNAIYAGNIANPLTGINVRYMMTGQLTGVLDVGLISYYMCCYEMIGMSCMIRRAQITNSRPGLVDWANVRYGAIGDAFDAAVSPNRRPFFINGYETAFVSNAGDGTPGHPKPDLGPAAGGWYYDQDAMNLAAFGAADPGPGVGGVAAGYDWSVFQGNGNSIGGTDVTNDGVIQWAATAIAVQLGEPNALRAWTGMNNALNSSQRNTPAGWKGPAFCGSNFNHQGTAVPFAFPQTAFAPVPPS